MVRVANLPPAEPLQPADIDASPLGREGGNTLLNS